MKTVETTVEADETGKAKLELELELTPGEHEVTVLISEVAEPLPGAKRYAFLDLPPVSIGEWPKGFSLRREDLYDDDGR